MARSHSNPRPEPIQHLNPPPVSEAYVAHCVAKATVLRQMFPRGIDAAGVAWLLGRSSENGRRVTMTAPDDRCRTIARILHVTGSHDGEWHHVEVMEAYRLRKLNDDALAALDPKPPAPAPVLDQFAQLHAFSRLLADKTQSAPPRS